MEIMFSNGVRYSIEFFKLILVVACILDIRVKKSINIIFGVSLIGVIAISHWFDLSEYSIIYGLIAALAFLMTIYERRNIGFVILSYIGISIIDMLFGVVCINIFHLTAKRMQDEFMLVVALNSISLIPIIILSVILKNINRKKQEYRMEKYLPVIILGGLSLSVYLTYVQFVGMENKYFYKNGLAVSAIVIAVVYSLVCYLLLKNQYKNHYLKIENDMNLRLLNAQNDYYSMMLKKEKETKMFRHDIKEHFMCIQMLYDKKKYDELGKYLNQLKVYTKELSPKNATGNMYIDMILVDLSEQFPDVIIEWVGKVPELSVTYMDICTLFYNLLKNAFEAAHNVLDKSVRIEIKTQDTNLALTVSNCYGVLNLDDNHQYITTKKEEGHGYGLKNIEKCVEKYHGFCLVTTEKGKFCTEIILPNVIVES